MLGYVGLSVLRTAYALTLAVLQTPATLLSARTRPAKLLFLSRSSPRWAGYWQAWQVAACAVCGVGGGRGRRKRSASNCIRPGVTCLRQGRQAAFRALELC